MSAALPLTPCCRFDATQLPKFIMLSLSNVVVSVVTGLRAGWFGIRFLAGVRDFCPLENGQIASGVHPVCCLTGTVILLLGVSSAEVKNVWRRLSAGPIKPSSRVTVQLYLLACTFTIYYIFVILSFYYFCCRVISVAVISKHRRRGTGESHESSRCLAVRAAG
jgi:hypothetical protein